MFCPDENLKRRLIEKEELLLDNGKRSDRKLVRSIVADGCMEIDGKGRKSYKASNDLDAVDGVLYITEDSSELRAVSEDTVLMVYEAVQVRKNTRTKANCSSLWNNADGEWKLVFSQRTILEA